MFLVHPIFDEPMCISILRPGPGRRTQILGKASKVIVVDLNCTVYPGNEYEKCLVVVLPVKTAYLERNKEEHHYFYCSQ